MGGDPEGTPPGGDCGVAPGEMPRTATTDLTVTSHRVGVLADSCIQWVGGAGGVACRHGWGANRSPAPYPSRRDRARWRPQPPEGSPPGRAPSALSKRRTCRPTLAADSRKGCTRGLGVRVRTRLQGTRTGGAPRAAEERRHEWVRHNLGLVTPRDGTEHRSRARPRHPSYREQDRELAGERPPRRKRE